ncbi:MAG: hypothetical protein RL696_796 [Actinomycetota bacterium]
MTNVPGRPIRKPSPFSVAISIIAVIAVVLFSAAGAYTDWLWFRQLDFEVVFLTEIAGQVVSFLVGWLVMTLLVAIGLALAWRNRPVYLRLPEASPFQAYQQMIEGVGKLVRFGLPVVVGIFGGLLASRQWETIALFLTGSNFGTTDAHFGLDVGFYVFQLPFWTFAVGYLSGAVLLAGLINGAVHLIYGGIRITGREVKGKGFKTSQSSAIGSSGALPNPSGCEHMAGSVRHRDCERPAVHRSELHRGQRHNSGTSDSRLDFSCCSGAFPSNCNHRTVAHLNHRNRAHGGQLHRPRRTLPMADSDLPGGSK